MKATLLGLTLSLAACATARPYAHDAWPDGVAAARAEALSSGRPCVIFYGVADSFDHIIGDWQEPFLRSAEFESLQGQAAVVACGRQERDEVGTEFGLITPSGGFFGPIVIVLDAKGKQLALFSAKSTGVYARDAIGRRPVTFAAMLHGRIEGVLSPGDELAEFRK